MRNSGDTVGTVRLYAVDGMTADNSGPVYLDEGAPRQDVGNWVQLTEREFSLGPNEERVVPFTVTIPINAPTGQHLNQSADQTHIPHAGDHVGFTWVSV